MRDPLQTIRLPHPAAGPPPCDAGVGDLLGTRFRLAAVVGWGGQAVVFRATDLRAARGMEPQVAVKIVRADLAADARREAEQVLRWEAGLLRRLRHPALPRLRLGPAPGGPVWLARDLVDGQSLATLAARAPLPPRRVHRWAIEILALLRHLHTCSPAVICCDLKPANLVVRPDGTLTLIDLGAASTLTRRPPRRPRPRHGTPGYAPPEQLGGWGLDERSDLFGLAATCYELLTGLSPASAPLQFDLARLDAVAPEMAPALRDALALDPAQRTPSAAVLAAALGAAVPPAPLALSFGARVTDRRSLVETAIRHPDLVGSAVQSGAVERWLASSPDRQLGGLLHDLRVARARLPEQARPLDALLLALAPPHGSPQIRVTPAHLDFGRVPLRRWRQWSLPQRMTLANPTADPLPWELESPAGAAEVRVLVRGKPQRHTAGVLAPGARAEILCVAAGNTGQHRGALTLRCGSYSTQIDWQLSAGAGLVIGGQLAVNLADINPARPGLAAELEALLPGGVLARWLAAQGERALAGELRTGMRARPDALGRRLLVARVLHRCDPARFPRLSVTIPTPPDPAVPAGSIARRIIELEHPGPQSYPIAWESRTPWARVEGAPHELNPGARRIYAVTLAPPAGLAAGRCVAELEVHAGSLVVPLQIPVEIVTIPWWLRALRALIS